jgi:hypothetical protein
MKATAQASAVVDESGTASTQRVDLSIMVMMWVKPSRDVGKGPTKSTWMWLNRA